MQPGQRYGAGSGNVAEGKERGGQNKGGTRENNGVRLGQCQFSPVSGDGRCIYGKKSEIDVELLDIQSDEYNNKLTVLLAGNESDPILL